MSGRPGVGTPARFWSSPRESYPRGESLENPEDADSRCSVRVDWRWVAVLEALSTIEGASLMPMPAESTTRDTAPAHRGRGVQFRKRVPANGNRGNGAPRHRGR